MLFRSLGYGIGIRMGRRNDESERAMIQFNRYRLPDETDDFHIRFGMLVNAIQQEMYGDMSRSVDMLRKLAHTYPHNDRLPAVAARMYFWGKVAWNDIQDLLPVTLPLTFFYKQELVGCLGFEQSWRKWGVTEDQWMLYQGLDTNFPSRNQPVMYVIYRPRNSGFFSIIENIKIGRAHV